MSTRCSMKMVARGGRSPQVPKDSEHPTATWVQQDGSHMWVDLKIGLKIQMCIIISIQWQFNSRLAKFQSGFLSSHYLDARNSPKRRFTEAPIHPIGPFSKAAPVLRSFQVSAREQHRVVSINGLLDGVIPNKQASQTCFNYV